ncbi:hypothetical protein NQ166_06255 [Microbacterium sp. zg.Y1090]|uniref:hypothetical protein n=1 Tax=Microbacterium wangruii TaxID=3049073 RepID=UPI00214C9E8E|nr:MULTISPECIES: hypothetical protein [unclassified Microbacterium]MCR2818440.1 hypothetical protein [Microbacterium sp. zg.Y1090]WIM29451.1 hypothetical protein QNO26_06065 [Microbacterium sp. zg-Y1090]
MSESYGAGAPTSSGAASGSTSAKVDTAKAEAADLKNTAASKASDVASTAKDEAATVIGEAGAQARMLYAQTQRELNDQASSQQQRVASGLRDMSSELASMSSHADSQGVASDLVRQAADRLSGAAAWLGDRDPAGVLAEVKSYARRRPGMFIAGAAILGVVAGRLTRALAANASDDKDSAAAAPRVAPSPVVAQTGSVADGTAAPVPPTSTPGHVDTPLYEQSTTMQRSGPSAEGKPDVRRDTL